MTLRNRQSMDTPSNRCRQKARIKINNKRHTLIRNNVYNKNYIKNNNNKVKDHTRWSEQLRISLRY
jgi:hypothetical protein